MSEPIIGDEPVFLPSTGMLDLNARSLMEGSKVTWRRYITATFRMEVWCSCVYQGIEDGVRQSDIEELHMSQRDGLIKASTYGIIQTPIGAPPYTKG